ncbi:hypothetical protein CspHIS471_0200260 [Cutaneotrichosporon sp. HIS471]|nr:hypothetical protein CspHIS471_0200260 [Cutaneotrichosporon sp. HIS471]
MNVRRYPLLLWTPTGNEIIASVIYTGLVIGLTLWSSSVNGKMRYLQPMGHAAFAQLPLVIGLAARNSVLSAVTGVSIHALKGLHRAAGRVCVITATVHSVGWLIKGFQPTWMFITGLVAWIPFLLLFISFAPIRRAAYEVFIAFHILMVVATLVGCWLHAPSMYFKAWIIAGIGLWGLDRFVSLARVAINTVSKGKPEVEVLSSEVVRVRVPSRLKWKAGQHGYLRTATQTHPFTFASPTEAVFLIRAHAGFTRRLLTSTPRIGLDGPYGTPPDLNAYATTLLITGGTGVSYGLAQLASIIAAARNHTSSAAQVRLVWNVRSASQIEWIAPLLNDALARGSEYVSVAVDVYVTRSHLSDEPGDGPKTPGPSPPKTPGNMTPRDVVSTPIPGITLPPAALLNKSTRISCATFGSVSIYSQACSTSLSLPDFTEVDLENGDIASLASSSSGDTTLAGDLEKCSLNFDRHPPFGSLAGRDIFGLSPAAALVTTLHRGRGDAETLLRADLATSDGGVAVAVCGPKSLDRDVRKAVLAVNGVSNALDGQPPVSFFSETFGM